MDRWNVSKRLKTLAISLAFAFALVVCPATRAFADYQSLTGTTSVTTSYINPFFVTDRNDSGITGYYDVTVLIQHNITSSTYYYDEPYYFKARANFTFNVGGTVYGTVNGSSVSYGSSAGNCEIIDVWNANFNQSLLVVDGVNVNATPAANKYMLQFSITHESGASTGTTVYSYYAKVRCWYNFPATSLAGIRSGSCKPSISISGVGGSFRIQTKGDFEPDHNSIVDIADAIQTAPAADSLDNANTAFVQDAAQIESHQAVLEQAADASVGAVDYNKINLIDTYSQSVSFWGQLIGSLPTVLGSFWYVFIFGLLIAFVLFVLRIRR